MRDFRSLKIWQKGMEIVDATYDVIEHLPSSEKFGLSYQTGKACVSIPSNIAEGCARKSIAHYVQYLETSLGSTYELQTQTLVIMKRFQVPKDLTDKLYVLLEEETKMLGSYIRSLNKEKN